MNKCINLKKKYGDRFRIAYDESRPTNRDQPWYQIIRCRGGHEIFPHGDNDFSVSLDNAPRLSKRLQAIGCRLHQSGNDGDTLLFNVELFDQVADIVKPYRKKRLSPEHKAALADRMRAIHAQKASKIAV